MDSVGSTVDSLIKQLQEASRVPARQRASQIKPAVDDLVSSLYDAGASSRDVTRLVDLITRPSHLDQASRGAIARSLYPATTVPGDALLSLLGRLGYGELKPPLAIQSLLLRWLVMVFKSLDDPGLLSRAYAVLFNLLDTAALRPQLCHVLALVTRRKHVRPFRIQALLSLSRQSGSDPALTGLLRVYKSYYPEIIVGDAVRGRVSAFKHPDPQWRSRLEEIQAAHVSGGRPEDPERPRNAFSVNHLLSKQMGGQKSSMIPAVHTLLAQEHSVTLEEVDSAESFVRSIEKIELPSQLAAVLADPLLQKLMALRSDDDAHARLSSWVMSCVSDVRSGDAGAELLLDMVEVLRGYVSNTQTIPPALLPLFRDLFALWDGVDRREAVVHVLSHAPLASFSQLYGSTFHLLEACLLDNTAGSQLQVLAFYTALLRRWRVLLLSAEDISPSDGSSISELVRHVNQLALTLSQTSPTPSTHLTILDFYDCAASLAALPRLARHTTVPAPPPTLVYIMHFSHSPAILSRLCTVVAAHKRALEQAVAHHRTPADEEQVATLNGLLMDLCNCIWRSKAFAAADATAIARGCTIPGPVVTALQQLQRQQQERTEGEEAGGTRGDEEGERLPPLASAFDVSHAPALCLLAREAMREMVGGPVDRPATQRSLAEMRRSGGAQASWQEYRLAVLRHLEQNQFGGVPELMHSTMKNLMNARP